MIFNCKESSVVLIAVTENYELYTQHEYNCMGTENTEIIYRTKCFSRTYGNVFFGANIVVNFASHAVRSMQGSSRFVYNYI